MGVLTITPTDGGQLLSRLSSGNVAPAQYTAKENLRRDLDVEHRREGWDYFYPTLERLIGEQPFPAGANEELTLVHLARRPNGSTAIIVGTPEKIWRYRGNIEPFYVADEGGERYVANEESEPPPGLDTYWDEVWRAWELIGDGFATYAEGACRWEVCNVNGWACFNNCVDPIFTYRIEDDHVEPIDELILQGVVRAKTIAEYYGFLFLGNITELTELAVLVVTKTTAKVWQDGHINSLDTTRVPNPPVTMHLTGNDLLTSQPFLKPEDVGRVIATPDSKWLIPTLIVSPSHAFVNGITDDRVGYEEIWVGDTEETYFFVTDLRDDISLATSAYYAYSDEDVFLPEWEGRQVSWPDGTTKRIAKFINARKVLMDDDRPVKAGILSVENPDKVDAVATASSQTRPFRTIWSMPGLPRRWGLVANVTYTEGSDVLTFLQDMTGGFVAGQEILVSGAGPSGGVLVTTIREIGPGQIRMRDTAFTSGTGTVVESEAAASATGFEDLIDDGSGILRMLKLEERLIIYKDSTNFICTYTGNVQKPMTFILAPMPHGSTLHFRNTLVEVNGNLHIYAGRNAFYSFDLTTRKPIPVDPIDLLQDLFFGRVTLEDTNNVFVCDNYITKEIFVVVPKPRVPEERVICFDYRYKTFSTSDMPLTAGATVIRPDAVQEVGETNHWFVFGNAHGTLLIYGLMRSTYDRWMTPPPYVSSIFYRRDARPIPPNEDLARYGYKSILATGKMSFADNYNEKDITGYVVHLSGLHDLSQNPLRALVEFSGSRNASEQPNVLGSRMLEDARKISSIPLWFRVHNIQETITIDGMDNPMRLQGRTWEGTAFPTRSITRALPS